MKSTPIAVAVCLGLICGNVAAQLDESMPPPNSVESSYSYATGTIVNNGPRVQALATHVVYVAGAPSLQIHVDEVVLGSDDWIEVTSTADGQVHRLTPAELAKWRNWSGHFNGDTLTVELFLQPGSTGSFVIDKINVGLPMLILDDSICGSNDDRTPSNDPRVARYMTVGCTIWLVSPDDCAFSAGHCFDAAGSSQSAQFNVPPSLPSGALQNPPIADQYPIDQSTISFVNGGVGNDWGVCKLLPNNLGQSAAANQGFFGLNFASLPAPGSTIRVTGYGVDSGTANQTQQTHTGPLTNATGTRLDYQVDTQGGNSGSPVIDEASGVAVGIHTHGGCGPNGGSNSGTSLTHPAVQAAFAALCNVVQPSGGYPGGGGKELTINGLAGPGRVATPAASLVTIAVNDLGAGGGSIMLVGNDFSAGFFPVPFGCAAGGGSIDLVSPMIVADGVNPSSAFDAFLSQPSYSLSVSFDCSYSGTIGPAFQALYVDPSCVPFQFELTAAAGCDFSGSAVTTTYAPGVLGDDDFASHVLGVPITYGGAVYGSVFVGTNGQITFGQGSGSFQPSPAAFSDGMGVGGSVNPGVATVWGDFNRVSSSGDIAVIEDACANRVTIQYNNQDWWDSQTPAGSWSVTFGNFGGMNGVRFDLSGALDGVAGVDQNPISGVSDGDVATASLNAIDFATQVGSYVSPGAADSVYEQWDHAANVMSSDVAAAGGGWTFLDGGSFNWMLVP